MPRKRKGASRYNKRIAVWGRVPFINDRNQDDFEDKLIKNVWAEIIPQTGKMQNQVAETVVSSTTHKMVVRFSAGKDIDEEKNWIMYGGKRYDIKFFLDPYEAHEEIELFTERIGG